MMHVDRWVKKSLMKRNLNVLLKEKTVAWRNFLVVSRVPSTLVLKGFFVRFSHSLLVPRSLVASKNPNRWELLSMQKKTETAQWRMQMQELPGQHEIGLSKLTDRREDPQWSSCEQM